MSKVKNPNGYPYTLFCVKGEDKVRYVAAISKETAIRNSGLNNVIEVEEASVSDLVKKIGHSKANNVFKSFNPTWMTSMGRVYYRTVE